LPRRNDRQHRPAKNERAQGPASVPWAILQFAFSLAPGPPVGPWTDYSPAARQHVQNKGHVMRHRQTWSSAVAAIGLCLGSSGSTAHADHHGRQSYDVVQGYIVLGPGSTTVPAQNQAPAAPIASPQNQAPAVGASPAPAQPVAQTITMQLAPAAAPVQTVQLAAAPAPAQTVQLTAAPVALQTVAVAPVQLQAVQLVAPAPVQALQVAPQQCATTPVTLLLPRHRCHWCFWHKN
jgi:hypothetical protein